MSILITGGAGFIGLNLMRALLERGEDVISLSLDEMPAAAARDFESLEGSFKHVRGSVEDGSFVKEVMQEHGVVGLFPLAAITAGREREALEPERVFSVNVIALIAQLRAARDCGVKRIIAPASGAVYGVSYFDRAVVDEETTPCRPEDIYGISKFAAEKAALRLARLWDLNLTVARIGGTFGPWERPTGVRDLVTPYFYLSQLAVARAEAVLPFHIPSYCWVYAKDIADGLCHLYYARTPLPGFFNVSSGIDWGEAIIDFAARLAVEFPGFTWRQSSDPAQVNVPFTDNRPRARLNVSKIAATGWKPAYLPAAAFEDYVKWIKGHEAIF